MKKTRPGEKSLKSGHAGELLSELPAYCDFTCRYAEFTAPEVSGACRREMTIYCRLMRSFNNKNAKCMAERPPQESTGGRL